MINLARTSIAAVLFGSLFVACDGSVDSEGTASNGTGAHGTSAASGTQSTGTGGSGGECGNGGMGGSDGGPVKCPPSQVFGVTITHNGVLFAQNGKPLAQSPTLTVQGALTVKGPGSFEIDACANIICMMPDVYQVTLDTAGVPVEIPQGTYVELTYQRMVFGGEPQVGYSAWIRNVPSLGGIANPTEAGNGLWVEGVVGFSDAGAPVQQKWIDMETCPDQCGYRAVDLVLIAADDASKSVRLSVGETKTWNASTAALPGSYTAKDLASRTYWNGMWDLSFVVARAATQGSP